jgi:hypothetical protein
VEHAGGGGGHLPATSGAGLTAIRKAREFQSTSLNARCGCMTCIQSTLHWPLQAAFPIRLRYRGYRKRPAIHPITEVSNRGVLRTLCSTDPGPEEQITDSRSRIHPFQILVRMRLYTVTPFSDERGDPGPRSFPMADGTPAKERGGGFPLLRWARSLGGLRGPNGCNPCGGGPSRL